MLHLLPEIRKHIIKGLIAILIIAFLIVQLEKFNGWLFTKGPDELRMMFDGFGWLSPIIFVTVYTIANVMLTPSYPFVFTAGIVYGPWWGTFWALVGEVVSAGTIFYLGRTFKKVFLFGDIEHEKVVMIRHYLENNSFFVILILRYIGFYFDIVSYVCGMCKVKFKPYILATFLGFMPYILIYIYAGVQLVDIRTSAFVYTIMWMKIALFASFGIGYVIYKYWYCKGKKSAICKIE